jgi:hypothetical protein
VKDLIADREHDDVRRALAEVRRRRPDDVVAYFRKVLGSRIRHEDQEVREPLAVPPLTPLSDEPY